MDSNVNEREFLEQLYELNHKINFVKQQTFNNARSCLDVKDILDKLKYKVKYLINITMLFNYLVICLLMLEFSHDGLKITIKY